MALSLKQLRYFTALAEAGHFGRAADKVHVSQPALSTQIKELEVFLGVDLVERMPREIRLTRAGQDVLDRSRRILAEVGDLEQAVRWRNGLAGRLQIGMIPTIAPYLLPPALALLRARDLTLDIRIREAQTDALIHALRRGQLDAAVLALPVAEPGLAATDILEDHFVLAGSRAALSGWGARAEALRPTAIDPDRLLLLDEGHCLADQALEICKLPSRRQVDLGASSLSTLCGLVAGGFGLTLLPELALRTELAAAPDLMVLRFRKPQPSRRIALVYRTGSSATEWAADLAGLMADAGAELISHARKVCQGPAGGIGKKAKSG
ncbi:LysR substrate-binding domain-containing protein [Aestuariibius insulae]|uniref:hydrogen peroxide-inducible genes activator n=1 Tax=Aestuariibius insulae TaxID=2058287 RepID=UPI00345E91CA